MRVCVLNAQKKSAEHSSEQKSIRSCGVVLGTVTRVAYCSKGSGKFRGFYINSGDMEFL